MTLSETLVSVWRKTLLEEVADVEIAGRHYPIGRTRSQALRTVAFTYQDLALEGIEQNPLTASRWAKLAQKGERIMQFKYNGRYIANVREGSLMRYPAWKALNLPD